MATRAAGNQFLSKLASTPPKTVDLPISTGDPVEIDTTRAQIREVGVYSRAEFRYTIATNAVTGKANLADKSKYFLAPLGFWVFQCGGEKSNKIYK